ncbi:hypothetical protein DVH24_040320, partial [Malus domestica]
TSSVQAAAPHCILTSVITPFTPTSAPSRTPSLSRQASPGPDYFSISSQADYSADLPSTIAFPTLGTQSTRFVTRSSRNSPARFHRQQAAKDATIAGLTSAKNMAA